MNERAAGTSPGEGMTTEPTKTDTDRLLAVEDAVRRIEPRVAKLEGQATETQRTLVLLKTMTETVLTKQAEIRDSLGLIGATRDAVVELMQKLDALSVKIDRLPCRDGGPE